MQTKRTRPTGIHQAAGAALAATLLLMLPQASAAQTNQLRGMPESGRSRLPTAEQQLRQNLNRQQQGFSIQQRIEENNRLNRTNQINRQNMQPDTTPGPCAGANTSCPEKED